jgi:hypothetical protein
MDVLPLCFRQQPNSLNGKLGCGLEQAGELGLHVDNIENCHDVIVFHWLG